MKRNGRILALQWFVAIALVFTVFSLIWPVFFLKMPFIKTKNMEASICEQVLKDAKAGAFSVKYHDMDSVQVDSLKLVKGHGFARATGIISTDMGKSIYFVVLRKVPLIGAYLYDTRSRFDSGSEFFDTEYILAIYELQFTPDTIKVRIKPFFGRVIILSYFFVSIINVRFKPRKAKQ